MRKLRILACGEASYLNTGFATYQHNLLKRLHATDKYDIAELATYCDVTGSDERWRNVDWTIIPVMPDRNNAQECQIYESNPKNEFGEWRFEEALLATKPDVVIDVRDFWHIDYQERSPLRPYYNWCIMPAVDSFPVDEPWLAMCMNADGVFSYTDFGLKVLNDQSNNKIKTLCEAPPGADFDAFKVVDNKAGLRRAMGLPEDIFIVGTVMRNQGRKLYPDLIEAFKNFLNQAPDEIGRKAMLYLHCAWPDLGWNIPRLIKEAGLGHKVLMTYYCKACQSFYPGYFQDCLTACKNCGQHACGFPTSQYGISTAALGQIMSIFDIYVQYSMAEGFGMPLAEAAACGVPVMGTDYSAMSDVVRKLNGIPLWVERYAREIPTHRYIAYPDNQFFIDELVGFFSKPESVRRMMGYEAHEGAKKYYDWDKTAAKWMEYLDKVPVTDRWNKPLKSFEPKTNIPDNLSNSDFVNWCITNMCGEPELRNSYLALRMVRDLNWGMTVAYGSEASYLNDFSYQGTRPKSYNFDRDIAIQVFQQRWATKTYWEQRRVASL